MADYQLTSAIHPSKPGQSLHEAAFARQYASAPEATEEEKEELRQSLMRLVALARHSLSERTVYQLPVRTEGLRQLAESLRPEELRDVITIYVYV